MLGERHPDFATSLNNLARLYYVMGRHVEAEPLLKQALELNREVLGLEFCKTIHMRAHKAPDCRFSNQYSLQKPGECRGHKPRHIM